MLAKWREVALRQVALAGLLTRDEPSGAIPFWVD